MKNLPVMQETVYAGDEVRVPGLGIVSGERNGAAGKSPDFVLVGSFGLPLEENHR